MTSEPSSLFIGCISGTSVDGLDIALLELLGPQQMVVRHADTMALPAELRHNLLRLGDPTQDNLDLLGASDTALGEFIGGAILRFLQAADTSPAQVQAIGSHGQTVRHRPRNQQQRYGFTTQIGDPNCIAEITGITTVADFRRRDMAAGGQGAPLVPPFHQALFGHLEKNTVVLNVGGISNISVLGSPPRGFDTGPGNCLMDSWSERHLQRPFDKDGQWAASGEIHLPLLERCLEDPYFSLPPPKSTGREYFNLRWLDSILGRQTIDPADVQATLCALTAVCTLHDVAHWAPSTELLIVCGGGRNNPVLMQHLAELVPNAGLRQVAPSESWQVDGDSLEAALFAWLASQRLANLAGSEPAVTGANGSRVLGAIYPG